MAEPKGKAQKKALKLSLDSVKVDHVNVTAVAQEDGDADFHDTVKVGATLDDAQLQEVFKSMGITKPAFFKNAPDELPKITLNAKYEGHVVRLVEGTALVAAMSDATIYDIKVERVGVSAFELELKFKGLPREFHEVFENAWLDGLRGTFYQMETEPPAKGANEDLSLDTNQESGEGVSEPDEAPAE